MTVIETSFGVRLEEKKEFLIRGKGEEAVVTAQGEVLSSSRTFFLPFTFDSLGTILA